MKLLGEKEGKVGLKRAKRPDWFYPRNIHLVNILENYTEKTNK